MTSNLVAEVHSTMVAINRAWRENQPAKMHDHLHPDITMVFPGFNGSIVGRDVLLASFIEFCSNARVLEYQESDEQIQVVDQVAFVSFRFNMLYERASYRERSIGRDLWAFARINDKWLAIWRTMVDLKEDRQTQK